MFGMFQFIALLFVCSSPASRPVGINNNKIQIRFVHHEFFFYLRAEPRQTDRRTNLAAAQASISYHSSGFSFCDRRSDLKSRHLN